MLNLDEAIAFLERGTNARVTKCEGKPGDEARVIITLELDEKKRNIEIDRQRLRDIDKVDANNRDIVKEINESFQK